MGEQTGISWTDHTFNPWWGCVEVSPACDNCYAKAWDKRCGGDHWGAHKPYRYFGEKHWQEPYAWDRAAKAAGQRARVFSGSMCDIFDNAANPQERIKLWSVIANTPHLEWLLLTKRPQNIWHMLPDSWGRGWPNVRLGVTTENQKEADRRIPLLQQVAAMGYFISAEPLLGPLSIGEAAAPVPGIGWVVAGGESGSKKSRPSNPNWFRQLRDDCAAAGVPFLFKQWGDWMPPSPSRDRPISFDAGVAMVRVGKKAAGRLLDGREHNEFPT